MRELSAGLDAGPVHTRVATAEHAALLAAACAATLEAPLFVIAPTATMAERVGTLIRWLLENGPTPFLFPRWPRGAESPYEEVVESPFVAGARAGALGALSLSETAAVLTMDASTAARRVLPFDAFLEGVQRLEVGRELDLAAVCELLIAGGYRRVSSVTELGEFAVRGGVFDVFSPFAEDPVRVELDGDVVGSLRVFDPATQRGQRAIARTWIVPAWEVPIDATHLRDGLLRLADAGAAARVASRDVGVIETLFHEGRLPAGFAAMLPIMQGGLDPLTTYLPEPSVIMVLDSEGCGFAADAARSGLDEDHARRRDERRILAQAGDLAMTGAELLQPLRQRPRTLWIDLGGADTALGPVATPALSSDLAIATAAEMPVRDRVAALVGLARDAADVGQRLLVLAPSDSEARRVRDILSAEGLETAMAGRDGLAEVDRVTDAGVVRVGVGRVKVPFGVEVAGLTVVPSEAVFGIKDALAGRRGERRGASRITELRELSPGDLIIHRDHGIGRFEGLKEMPLDGRLTECLVLTYKAGDRLYVPVERANLLDKYSAPAEGEATHTLDRLGSPAWQKRKGTARRAAREIAGSLRILYARRLAATAFAFSPPDNDFREFEATFPYETTPDQERAIEEVLEDLGRDRPMDRLVCGDVGFGKTEVAVRAAYKAVMDGKQVAILVPTTLLAEQHRLTFAARLRNTPITVESLSRLKAGVDEKRVLEGVRTGGVDVLIGTHRLLSKDVAFHDLGLLVVDEEHRFGVAHKERLREMSANVHTLTLSATPIPRTLHMALAGIRELSVIATPPKDRLAVKTFVAHAARELLRTAITREIGRGGQVFVVHNRVQDIYDFANGIQATVPEARVVVAHGQMSAGDLESVMAAFVRGEKDVLVCTTIIESGLDIGTANTMLIHEAESLGLAQLYQLRGRVGRSAEQAYCYLLVRDPDGLGDEARKRIEAIERYSELASGFNLAAMDLEIRGAGDVLGAEQSGHMMAVGYDLFMEMLQDAVNELSGEPVAERLDPELKIGVEARFPPEYVPDERLRLRFYKRLAAALGLEEVLALAAEIADRFGPPPEPVDRLLALMRIKALARELGIAAIAVRPDGAREGRHVALMTAATGHESTLDQLATVAPVLGLRAPDREAHDRLRLSLPPAVPALVVIEDLLRTTGTAVASARPMQ